MLPEAGDCREWQIWRTLRSQWLRLLRQRRQFSKCVGQGGMVSKAPMCLHAKGSQRRWGRGKAGAGLAGRGTWPPPKAFLGRAGADPGARPRPRPRSLLRQKTTGEAKKKKKQDQGALEKLHSRRGPIPAGRLSCRTQSRGGTQVSSTGWSQLPPCLPGAQGPRPQTAHAHAHTHTHALSPALLQAHGSGIGRRSLRGRRPVPLASLLPGHFRCCRGAGEASTL